MSEIYAKDLLLGQRISAVHISKGIGGGLIPVLQLENGVRLFAVADPEENNDGVFFWDRPTENKGGQFYLRNGQVLTREG